MTRKQITDLKQITSLQPTTTMAKCMKPLPSDLFDVSWKAIMARSLHMV